jgi:hypothetical protein
MYFSKYYPFLTFYPSSSPFTKFKANRIFIKKTIITKTIPISKPLFSTCLPLTVKIIYSDKDVENTQKPF